MHSRILIIDIETTGFSLSDKIVEIGVVDLCLNTGERTIMFNHMCHEDGITRKAVEDSWIVNNSSMTVDDVRESKNLNLYKAELQDLFNLYPAGATAFNNTFDFKFLENRGFKFPRKLACPMRLATNICQLPKKKGAGYKFPNVEEAYSHFVGKVGGDGYIEQHRGADDAMHEASIVQALFDKGIFKLSDFT